jgi:hypothetical protein
MPPLESRSISGWLPEVAPTTPKHLFSFLKQIKNKILVFYSLIFLIEK